MKSIRLRHNLTRAQLAEATNRSINYILKAESCTPTSAPVALTNYYSQTFGYDRQTLEAQYRQEQKLIRRSWLQAYKPSAFVRAGHRGTSTSVSAPVRGVNVTPGKLTFRRMWQLRAGTDGVAELELEQRLTGTAMDLTSAGTGLSGTALEFNPAEIEANGISEVNANHGPPPTQYALSQGLCLPASAVHKNERDPQRVPRCFLVALGDLLEYVESGEFKAAHPDSDPDEIELMEGLLTMQRLLL